MAITEQEIYRGLNDILPGKARRWMFLQPPAPPYAVYYVRHETVRGADKKNLIKEQSLTVELFAEKEDKELEGSIDALLSEVHYEKYTNYLQDEKLYMTSYEFEQTLKEDING